MQVIVSLAAVVLFIPYSDIWVQESQYTMT